MLIETGLYCSKRNKNIIYRVIDVYPRRKLVVISRQLTETELFEEYSGPTKEKKIGWAKRNLVYLSEKALMVKKNIEKNGGPPTN